MNEPLGKQITGENPPAPWLAFTQWLAWPGGRLGDPSPKIHNIRKADPVTEMQRAAIAMQLATSIRMQGIDDEAGAMLGLLEGLLAAGEIPHEEYFRRVENLFADQISELDLGLQHKLTMMLAA